jgi:hypothetical protein
MMTSFVLIKPKKISTSMPSELMWLMLICVAEICVALFQSKSPLPGLPVVAEVSAL